MAALTLRLVPCGGHWLLTDSQGETKQYLTRAAGAAGATRGRANRFAVLVVRERERAKRTSAPDLERP